ncbi:MAG: hypothetical protein ACK5C0_04670 [Candidatus Kapaibacterium sp.]|jgi:hypothetical protein
MNTTLIHNVNMKALFSISICFFCSCFISFAYRAPDSCLKRMYYADGSEYEPNPDSVRIDSCIGSATFGLLYAKKTFLTTFEHKLMYYGKDTVLNTYYHKTWHDILPQFTAIKSIFAQIDSLFGPYMMIKIMPRAYSDTVESSDIARNYFLEFDNYVPIDAVVALLANMPDIDIYRYMDRRLPLTALTEKEESTKIYMIGTQSFVLPLSQTFEHIVFYDLIGNEVYQCSAANSIIEEPKGISKGLYWIRFGSTVLPYYYAH